MARQEVGKVQEMLMVSAEAHQEPTEETESSENKGSVVGWTLSCSISHAHYRNKVQLSTRFDLCAGLW